MTWNFIRTHWRTTANGVLAFLLSSFGVILGFQIPSALMNPHASKVWLYVTLACTLGSALCRAWIGLLQKDAGKELAIVPPSPKPKAVPAHAVPDDPKAQVVIPPKQGA